MYFDFSFPCKFFEEISFKVELESKTHSELFNCAKKIFYQSIKKYVLKWKNLCFGFSFTCKFFEEISFKVELESKTHSKLFNLQSHDSQHDTVIQNLLLWNYSKKNRKLVLELPFFLSSTADKFLVSNKFLKRDFCITVLFDRRNTAIVVRSWNFKTCYKTAINQNNFPREKNMKVWLPMLFNQRQSESVAFWSIEIAL